MNATVVGFDCENQTDDLMAAQMVSDLCQAYPGHGWFVVIRSGVIHVKDMDINDKWGMCLHYSQVKGDAKDRKRDLLRAAGEFLERANLRRGAKSDDVAMAVEGIPDKHLTRVGL
jgi:hypothetical protein